MERSVGMSDGEGMEEVRERDRRKWRCGLPLRSYDNDSDLVLITGLRYVCAWCVGV